MAVVLAAADARDGLIGRGLLDRLTPEDIEMTCTVLKLDASAKRSMAEHAAESASTYSAHIPKRGTTCELREDIREFAIEEGRISERAGTRGRGSPPQM